MSGPGVASADLYTRFVSQIVFPLHERLKGHTTVRVRRELETSQWWSRDRIAELQQERLRLLLAHARQHVPYYRSLFHRLDLAPDDVRGGVDLGDLPFLTKDDIRSHTEALKSEQAVGLSRSNTGGSSGEPLVFWLGRERVSHDVAAKWRATRWWDVDIGDPEIVVWGSPVELAAQDRVRALRDRLLRTRLLPAFEMSAANLDRFVDVIRKFRPRMLFGYPSALAHIARHAATKQVPMHDLGIRVAFVTSERLYDDQRADITRVFGCPVANGYGGRDAGFIAHACPAGGMHVTAEDVIVEIVDPQGRRLGPGEPGEIVVTHLASRDFPFVRYRTGDVAALDSGACACGRGLPLLKEIQGRTTDFVVARDGTVMHGLALIYVMRERQGVEAFRIVQESLDLTRVLVVPTPQFDRDQSDAIVRGFKRRLGPEVEVRVETVTTLPPDRSGKLRYVQSRVPSGRALPSPGTTPEPAAKDPHHA